MHEMRVLPCPLEVPPTRARRLGGAEEKNAGGGRTIGVWTRLFRGGGGRTLAHLFRGGGVEKLLFGGLVCGGGGGAGRTRPRLWMGALSSQPASRATARGVRGKEVTEHCAHYWNGVRADSLEMTISRRALARLMRLTQPASSRASLA